MFQWNFCLYRQSWSDLPAPTGPNLAGLPLDLSLNWLVSLPVLSASFHSYAWTHQNVGPVHFNNENRESIREQNVGMYVQDRRESQATRPLSVPCYSYYLSVVIFVSGDILSLQHYVTITHQDNEGAGPRGLAVWRVSLCGWHTHLRTYAKCIWLNSVFDHPNGSILYIYRTDRPTSLLRMNLY
jgi:hypothetical protein